MKRPVPTNADLDRMQWLADPYADATLAQVVAGATTPFEWARRIGELNDIIQKWATNGDVSTWTAPPGTPPYIAGPLATYVAAARLAPPPKWIVPERVDGAGRQFMDHGALSIILLHCASLPESYVVPDTATVLQATGELIHRVDHRIRATGAMIVPAMMVGGLTTMGGSGIAQVLKVRLIHAAIRCLILYDTPRSDAQPRRITKGPLDLPKIPVKFRHFAALYNLGDRWDLDLCGLPNNQEDLAYTLLTFSYVFLRSMDRLGIPFSAQEEEDYLLTWNVVGHYMGIDESLLMEDMDSAAELFSLIQQRGRGHLKQHPGKDARPVLGAALMTAMERVMPDGVFEPFPVLMTRYLIEPQSARDLGLDTRPIPAASQALFTTIITAARALDAIVRLFSPNFSMCRLIARAVGYRLICELMMNETEPLLLPDELQSHVEEVIAAWRDDPKAPRWMNALEDWFTTQGKWKKRVKSKK
jgi:hypothetical protein